MTPCSLHWLQSVPLGKLQRCCLSDVVGAVFSCTADGDQASKPACWAERLTVWIRFCCAHCGPCGWQSLHLYLGACPTLCHKLPVHLLDSIHLHRCACSTHVLLCCACCAVLCVLCCAVHLIQGWWAPHCGTHRVQVFLSTLAAFSLSAGCVFQAEYSSRPIHRDCMQTWTVACILGHLSTTQPSLRLVGDSQTSFFMVFLSTL